MSILDTWIGEKVSVEHRAIMGFGGVTIQDSSVDVLDMIRSFMDKAALESCGQCFPCRNGLKGIAKRLNLLCEGESSEDDVAYLEKTAHFVMASARCDIGQTSPQALIDIIKNAPHLLKARKVNKGTYTSLVTAPCINACPGHVDIPTYIEKIRYRQFEEGMACVMNKCAMPGTIGRVCERPCEKACKRGQNDSPLAIRHLKRFLFDYSHVHGYSEVERVQLENEKVKTQGVNVKQKVAVIGAGPAGLSCAYYLARRGFFVTIFEKLEASGGMAKYGIPDYRLPAHILEEEVARVQALGVEIRYGIDIGKDLSIQELELQGFEATFIATGAPLAPGMRCEGENDCTHGFISGIEYLREATKGNKIISGKRVVVVGGGNVAMDCVRTALRHGFNDVQIVYRRTEQEMPADKMEIHEAKLEGVHFNFLVAPEKILQENGHVRGLSCQKMKLGEADASGRCAPIPIEGEKLVIDCDVIIHAIGQKVMVDYIVESLADEEKTGLDKYNNLNACDLTGKVHDFKNIFGGGDCVTGPKTLIAALAAGERAAAHIAHQLEGKYTIISEREKLEKALKDISLIAHTETPPPADNIQTMPIHMLDVEERLEGFKEVEKGSSDVEACKEASRCLRCLRIVMVAS